MTTFASKKIEYLTERYITNYPTYMKKKFKESFLLTLTLTVSVASYAQTEINGLNYNLNSATKEAELVSTEMCFENLTIPSSVFYDGETYNVTSIGYNAFKDCTNIESVTIPNSVTNIEQNAFENCYNLTSVTLSNSLTSIENFTFSNCTLLTSITIPNSVTTIGYGAFCSCTSLQSVTIPNSVAQIESRAFENCYGLTSITLPNSLISIADETFKGCTGLTSITIPSSVMTIDNSAFYNCSNLTSVTIPDYVRSIGNEAFFGCEKLTSVKIPKSVSNIGNKIFGACSSLASIEVESGNDKYDSRENCNAVIETASNTLIATCKNTVIPNTVTSIGNQAFYSSDITSITIPNSVTSIGREAFAYCDNLASITIPASVTSIGNEAFFRYNTKPYLSIINLSETPQPITEDTFFAHNGTLHILPGCKAAYLGTENYWGLFTIVDDADQPSEVINVYDMIAAIGKVEDTEECKALIAAARSAYDALPAELQALVKNISILIEAEDEYEQYESKTSGIADVKTKDENKDGKLLVNGKIVIVKNGKTYNVAGVEQK